MGNKKIVIVERSERTYLSISETSRALGEAQYSMLPSAFLRWLPLDPVMLLSDLKVWLAGCSLVSLSRLSSAFAFPTAAGRDIHMPLCFAISDAQGTVHNFGLWQSSTELDRSTDIIPWCTT